MTLVAIDTSVLIGLIDARDVWHRAALQLQAALRAARRLREQRRVQEHPELFARHCQVNAKNCTSVQ